MESSQHGSKSEADECFKFSNKFSGFHYLYTKIRFQDF